VALDSDFTVVMGMALKYLGYSLTSGDSGELDDAIAWLSELRTKQDVEVLAWDAIFDRLATGELCAGQTYNGDAAFHMKESDNLAFFVPSEGADFYLDSMAIPRDAENKLNAELFINYMLRPDMHAANNEYTGYAVPNRASIEGGYVSDELRADPVRYPDTTSLEPWIPFIVILGPSGTRPGPGS
jgi:spermidine/putrescine-binding protein